MSESICGSLPGLHAEAACHMCEVAKKPTFAVVHIVFVLIGALDGPLLDDAGWMVLSVPPSAVHARPDLQRQLHLQRPWPVSTCLRAEASSRAHL